MRIFAIKLLQCGNRGYLINNKRYRGVASIFQCVLKDFNAFCFFFFVFKETKIKSSSIQKFALCFIGSVNCLSFCRKVASIVIHSNSQISPRTDELPNLT